MQTLNISVTKEQYGFVQKLIRELGFANRSEFFRAILRSLAGSQEMPVSINFERPPTRSAHKVFAAFQKTGKYNKQFLASLQKGLKESSYFNANN